PGDVMTRLLSYMAVIAKDCEPPSMALFMRKLKPTMSCRKFSFRSGRKPVGIQPRRANHLDGWSRSRVGVPSIPFDVVRLIRVRGSVMKNEWSRNHRLLAATRQRHLC